MQPPVALLVHLLLARLPAECIPVGEDATCARNTTGVCQDNSSSNRDSRDFSVLSSGSITLGGQTQTLAAKGALSGAAASQTGFKTQAGTKEQHPSS
jgi:hypothetical protein